MQAYATPEHKAAVASFLEKQVSGSSGGRGR